MNRITIGIFSDWAESAYHKSLLSGMIESAKELDFNTITYLGGAINAPNRWENERNLIYHYINPDIIKGIIIFTGTIGRFCQPENINKFCQKYFPIPVISVSLTLPNIHSIVVDNKTGIYELMKHLIEKHNYKKIAFICGTDMNQEAQDRLAAYKESLAMAGMPLDPNLIVPGSFTHESGVNAIKLLLDERNITVDAIIAANDDMALGAVNELQKRGIKIPEQIAVAGFDDQEQSQYINPPLTTIAQPLNLQGRRAMEAVAELINGRAFPLETILHSKLIIRQSCGCPFWEEINHFKDKFEETTAINITSKPTDPWQWVKEQFIFNIDEFSDSIGGSLLLEQVMNFIESFFDAIKNRNKEIFIDILHKFLSKGNKKINIEIILSKALALLTNLINRKIKNTDELIFSKDLAYIAQLVINRHLIEIYKEMLIKIEQVHQIIHYSSGEALTITSQDAVLKLLYEKLDIKEPEKSISRLCMAYADNKPLHLPNNGIIFSSTKLFPSDTRIMNKRFSYIIEPLFFGPLHFGTAILETEIQLNSLMNTMFRWFLNSVIIVELFVVQMQKERTTIEDQMTTRTGELHNVNKKLSHTLSKLKATQTSLLQQAKMASLGRLTSGIAHELKNPLNFINNFSKISIEDTKDLSKIIAKYLPDMSEKDKQRVTEILCDIEDNSEEVYKHGLYADKIIKGMLNQARGESKVIETCRINYLLKEILSLAYRSHRSTEPDFDFTIIEELDNSIPDIKANLTDMNKVFINFIDNALYALHRISTKPDYKPTLKIVTKLMNREIIIQFTDNGPGIKEDVMEHIYDPFFTTKPTGEGTGIGLTTCYEIIVERMGGELFCESTENEGTTFTIRLKII